MRLSTTSQGNPPSPRIQYLLFGLAMSLVLTPLLPEMRRYYRIQDRRAVYNEHA